MTGLAGLLLLNAVFLGAGSGLLWAVRGWSDWGDWLALSGVAYVLGLASTTVLMTVVLSLGGGVPTGEILLVALGLAGAGLAGGVAMRRPRPRLGRIPRPRTPADGAALALAAGTAVLLGGLFRVSRSQPLTDWDAWSFWIPKAKIIYFFGGIDSLLFRSLDGPSYPLFVPALDAMDFRFIGAADTTLLGVQYWLLLVGLVAAMAGLLRSLAPPVLVWLFAMSAVVLPALDHRLLARTGDWPLDICFCLAALGLVRWLLTQELWALAVFGVMLAATLATKREGQLLAACLVVGGIAALGWRRRRSWLAVVGVAAAAYAMNVPWRVWWTSRHLTGDTPAGGLVGSTFHLSRAPESFRLVLRLVFDFQLWHGAVPVTLVAALILLTQAQREAAVFYLVTGCLGVVAWAWVNWTDPTLVLTTNDAQNPTDRAVGSLALLSVVTAPLLLGTIFRLNAAGRLGLDRWPRRPVLP
jgi:hypothetical protein